MIAGKVLVYDDEPNVAEGLAEEIRAVYDGNVVHHSSPCHFQSLLQLVHSRRASWREGSSDVGESSCHEVDDADVIVVDYDLLQYSGATADTTGSRLAYLLRCFSTCGFIVVLNEYGTNRFDAALGSPTDEFADLHLGYEQVGNPGLWSTPFHGFRPWHWPVIPDARSRLERCVKDVLNNLDEPIVAVLGLDRVLDWLPRRALDFLSGRQRAEEVTFRDFVANSRGGVATKDNLVPSQIARVAAARIQTLLNHMVLPEQSSLVDAPHLASRFPSLIADDRASIGTWNRLCVAIDDEVDELLTEGIKQYKFQKSHWLWRPAWYWPDLNKDEAISEVRDPWSIEDVNWVFCEDISQFASIEHAQEFRALVSPPFIKRFIFRRESTEAMKWLGCLKQPGSQSPRDVEYAPLATFDL